MTDDRETTGTTRRRILARAGGAGAVATAGGPLGLAGRARGAGAAQFRLTTGPPVGATPIASGFTSPLDFAVPPTDGEHRYVVDQPGRIHAVGPDGDRTTFLDIRDRVVDVRGGYDERGLLGLAFHPEYPDNGRFYVRYSAPPRDGTPSGYSHTFVLAEVVADGPTAADPTSERTVLEIPEPQGNHNAGAIAFGPDGYLYVGVGDGGGANDVGTGHVEDWYDAVPGGNGQDVEANLLGSLLRIDVDARSDDRPYGIPEDNPLVGSPGLDEHYAWGLRNPWGMSFDGEDLFVADVGQNRYEEINRVEKGGNYGWNVREGAHCFRGDECVERTPEGEPLLDPVVEYPHDADGERVGQAVIGGHRYRGDAVAALTGAYVFGDWLAQDRLFAATPGEDTPWPVTEHPIRPTGDPGIGRHLLAIGRGRDDELYLLTTEESGVTGSTGRLHRLVGGDSDDDGPDATTATTAAATPTTTPGQAGFGVLGGLVGLGWLAYRAWREA